jgi:hypothetical protein
MGVGATPTTWLVVVAFLLIVVIFATPTERNNPMKNNGT